MAIEEILVQGKSKLIVSKAGRTYFTVTHLLGDGSEEQLICYKPKIYNDINLGNIIKLDVTRFEDTDKTPRIDSIAQEGEVVPSLSSQEQPTLAEAPAEKQGQRAPHLRDESIERQVCIKEIGECWRNGKLKDDDPLVIAYKAYIVERMGDYYEAAQIVRQTKNPKAVAEDETVHSETGDERPDDLDWFYEHRDEIEKHAVWLKAYLVKIGAKIKPKIFETLESMDVNTRNLVKEELEKQLNK